ncbi:hypothetical protein GH714_001300 [Hevea brasiliensis]|uniref:Serine aminopeptidase S33 domain-containing protein n=1 Tax=Hevea brasiliensis TaxID=3981 RepID=A0A6A6LQC0_HEVBR|nr:hypothetical protein GH714_001300 [Hevea brasiliensis]
MEPKSLSSLRDTFHDWSDDSWNCLSLFIVACLLLPLVPQQEKVIIPNKHGEKLVGLLHDTGSKEIVVLCHGFRSTKENETMVNLAVALENEGISAFRFDFAGNGESEGSFAYGNYWREVDDLRAVVEHFSGANHAIGKWVGKTKIASCCEVDGNRTIALPVRGQFGAPICFKYSDISSVVNVSGRYDLNRGIEERLGKDFMEKIKQEGFFDVKNKTEDVTLENPFLLLVILVNMFNLASSLSTLQNAFPTSACVAYSTDSKQILHNRVFTVHGSADEIIPVEDALEFAKIISNHKLHIIEGANHSYTSHQAELSSAVLNFIKETLQQDKGTPN